MNFDEINLIDVNKHVEKREQSGITLSYLSWTYAIQKFKKIYPDFTYGIKKFDNGRGALLPYMYDENTGYMVFTSITAGGLTQEMWLPVMDSNNKAMKSEPYQYTTKYGTKTVQSATMFDVNKTIMRCLVKNMAMFGLGLYIYAGEDLPTSPEPELQPELLKAIDDCKTVDELGTLYNNYKETIDTSLVKVFNKLVADKKKSLLAPKPEEANNGNN